MEPIDQGLGHYCGVAGLFSPEPINIPERLFYMLFSLQHRGQESCGMAWEEGGRYASRKDLGMVAPVLGRVLGEERKSSLGIGHVRYSTAGGGGLQNAQPIVVGCNKGRLALAHNGNLSNGGRLREELTAAGSIFQGSADSELILHLISRSREAKREAFLREALAALEGAYSLTVMHEDALVAIRDPSGFRPLYVGTKGGATYVASETCALHAVGPMDYREIEPGEVLIVDKDGARTFFLEPALPRRSCVFELIYFARPDSEVFGESVHGARVRLGEALAELDAEAGLEADVVVPVPDSGNISAIGYARRAGIPFDFGLARSHYAGRSFILPTKDQRELAARLKLHAVSEVVAGKRVVMIDDSLVRGTTSRIIVGLLREAGAREVHLRLAAPELKWPCHYGIDIPSREELISNRLDPAGIAREVGADSVRFLPVDRLLAGLDKPSGYCAACFDGNHPFRPDSGGKERR
ncbi:MAG: amidophosphoribosyltransferase [Spirochaetaceae bacterium]|nr:amidophosphoribosyltransferase [Spirochaetaceae bacterium]